MSQDCLELDEIDSGVLQLLQQDARNYTTREIGEHIGVSGSTVSNRISKLEDDGVILGYTIDVDFEQIGVNPKMLLVCTAPAAEREAVASEAIDIDGVVDVRTVLTGARNVHVTAIGRDIAALSTVTQALESIGLEIVDSGIVNEQHRSPFDHFGEDAVDAGSL
ncbi:Lrp/AsnC family transcriptional regulator [Halobacteria archaeon AArc-dxtr1]|nr:Lrp/AsnC family transcriptional regulator [Halobacteria archaeon AArc-dxtr1]